MHLTILTPTKELLSRTIESVQLPGAQGNFQVLKNHHPLISTLQKGTIAYRANGNTHMLHIRSGIAQILHNNIYILVESN